MNDVQVVDGQKAPAKWFIAIDDRRIPMPRSLVSEDVIRAQANVPDDRVIVRDHNDPDDEVIKEGTEVKLPHGNFFYTLSKSEARDCGPCSAPAKVAFSINDRIFETTSRSQTGRSLLDLAGLAHDVELFRDCDSEQDPRVLLDEHVQFGDGPEFYTRGHEKPEEVEITINRSVYKVKRGNHSVADLKKIGGVAPQDEVDQLIDRKLIPLEDNASVAIKGGEAFISHPRSGGSS